MSNKTMSDTDLRTLFDMLMRKTSMFYQLSNAKRTNSAPKHNDKEYLERAEINADEFMSVITDATNRLR